MHRIVALALAALLAAGCADGPAGAADGTSPQATHAETQLCGYGVVTDSELRPLPGVVVTVGPANATTGTDGAFELCGLTPGAHETSFAKPGYVATNRSLTVPSDDRIIVELEREATDDRRIVTRTFPLHYMFGYATWDATLGRQGVNASTCEPCTFEFTVDDLPDIVYLEADWTRTFMPPEGARDLMFHVFRAGAPFEAGDDLGSGSKEKPFAFNYPRHEIEKNGNATNGDGTYSFSGLVACDGNAPCVDQRIDVWVSLFYEHERVPTGFTAVGPRP